MSRQSNAPIARGLCLAILLAGTVIQPSSAASKEDLELLVVVANRRGELPAQIPNAISVFDARAIKSSQAITLTDLLISAPGVSYARNGGYGGVTSLFIRGAESAQTLVIYDGVKLNDPSAPAAAFDVSNLLVGDIDRVEILRGPQSTLWGSQGIGGVVNIRSKLTDQALAFDGQAEYGSHDTGYLRLGAGGRTGPAIWRIAGGLFNTSGISTFDKAFGGRERDGARQAAITAKLDYALADNLHLDLRGLYTDARNDYDGFPAPKFILADSRDFSRTQQTIGYAALRQDVFGGRLNNRLAAQWGQIERQNFDPTSKVPKTADSNGINQRVEYQGTAHFSDDLSGVFGAEHERASFTTQSPSTFQPNPPRQKANASLTGFYGQIQWMPIKDLNLVGGLRHDDHDRFGGHETGQLGLAYAVTTGTILRANFGQGFKAPSLYQLYSVYGNTALKPETADSFDGGIEQSLWDDKASVKLTYFNRRSSDLVNFVSCGGTPDPLCTGRFGYYANISKAKADGVEIEARADLNQFGTLTATYAHTDSIDRSAGATFNKSLARRPNDSANLTWARTLYGIDGAIALRYTGASFDDAANRRVLAGRSLVDLRAAYPLGQTLEIYARVENLFDKTYSTIYQYGTLGRTGFVGLRAKY